MNCLLAIAIAAVLAVAIAAVLAVAVLAHRRNVVAATTTAALAANKLTDTLVKAARHRGAHAANTTDRAAEHIADRACTLLTNLTHRLKATV